MSRNWIAGLAAALLVACGSGGNGADSEILVSAAASLMDAFAEMEAAFEAEHPSVDVVLNLGGSVTLREQILLGASVDVFAAADEVIMRVLQDEGHVAGQSQVFASNHLTIGVPSGNPGGIRGLSDFENAELLLGICASEVPCGRLAADTFAAAGVTPSADTIEPSVRSLLAKIDAGELDGGLVYVTDVAAASGVELIEIEGPSTAYPIASLSDAPNPDGASEFVSFVLSDEGQSILLRHGFGTP